MNNEIPTLRDAECCLTCIHSYLFDFRGVILKCEKHDKEIRGYNVCGLHARKEQR